MEHRGFRFIRGRGFWLSGPRVSGTGLPHLSRFDRGQPAGGHHLPCGRAERKDRQADRGHQGKERGERGENYLRAFYQLTNNGHRIRAACGLRAYFKKEPIGRRAELAVKL